MDQSTSFGYYSTAFTRIFSGTLLQNPVLLVGLAVILFLVFRRVK
jgi:hypothetical protein